MGFEAALRRLLDLNEDKEAGRWSTTEEFKKEEAVIKQDVLKNIPEDFAIDFVMFTLNTVNPEKVNAKVMQSKKGQEWFTDSQLHKHYSV